MLLPPILAPLPPALCQENISRRLFPQRNTSQFILCYFYRFLCCSVGESTVVISQTIISSFFPYALPPELSKIKDQEDSLYCGMFLMNIMLLAAALNHTRYWDEQNFSVVCHISFSASLLPPLHLPGNCQGRSLIF